MRIFLIVCGIYEKIIGENDLIYPAAEKCFKVDLPFKISWILPVDFNI